MKKRLDDDNDVNNDNNDNDVNNNNDVNNDHNNDNVDDDFWGKWRELTRK